MKDNKKILMYIDCMQMGGANRVISNLVNYFDSIGVDVILVNDIEADCGVMEYEVSETVKRFYLTCPKANILSRNSYRIKHLRKIIKMEKPDTVLSFLGPPNIRMLIATIGLSVKKVVSVRNDPYREYGKGLKKAFVRILFNLSTGCVFQTEDARKYFGKKVRNNSCIIFNPVNEKFYSVKREKIEDRITVVGRLQAQKNPLLVLEAFAEIANEYPSFELEYYGDGELKAEIIKRSTELKIQDRVHLYGKVYDIDDRLSHSSLYVLCSDFEGMPNSLMEAMAIGVPLISTDCPCGGPRTLITSELEGFLVPCGDIETLSSSMRKILDNVNLREQMSLSERKRAEMFKSEKILTEWYQYLIQ